MATKKTQKKVRAGEPFETVAEIKKVVRKAGAAVVELQVVVPENNGHLIPLGKVMLTIVKPERELAFGSPDIDEDLKDDEDEE